MSEKILIIFLWDSSDDELWGAPSKFRMEGVNFSLSRWPEARGRLLCLDGEAGVSLLVMPFRLYFRGTVIDDELRNAADTTP